MERKVLKAIVAISLVITLTMANFLFLGASFVSYAIGTLNQSSETNNKNVKFSAYFKTENGERVDIKEESIAEENMKLYMEISVQDEGYFNGKVEILDSNFEVKADQLSEGINKIEGNQISLNQIRAGETMEVELGIAAKQGNVIDLSLLNMESQIKLSGIYTNSKADKIDIEATKQVKLILEDPYEENNGAILDAQILTNKVYNIEGTNKRVVQIKINSSLEENKYPVKSTNIELNVPEEVEDVKVTSLGTEATNGKDENTFTEDNWEYIKEENKLQIKIENQEQNGKITWNKNAKDTVVVTYILPEEVEVTENEINTKAEITLYNSKVTTKTVENTIKVGEEKDGTIEIKTKNEEKSIYKGKIYAKQEREYKTKLDINVNYPEAKEGIEVSQKQATYVDGERELIANTQYKQTKISKEDILNVLGEEGTIEIADQDGRQIAKITSKTIENEQGQIEVNYEDGVKELTIKTSAPVATGIIKIENTKVIKAEEYETETLKEMKEIKQETVLTHDGITITDTNKIALKETTTKAKMEINKKSLSTVVENKGLEIKATLVTDNEKYDLYKNPTIKVKLPSQVENVKVNSINLLYDEELKVGNARLYDDNGAKVIEINLQGEQTKYIDSQIAQGATIIINANMTLNKKIANSTEKIKIEYTNEKATSPIEQLEKEIEIVAPTGMVVANTMEQLNIETIGQEEEKTKIIETGKEAKQEEVKIEVINNNEAEVKDVKILGSFPTKNSENTIKTTITKGITAQGIDPSKVKIYYSQKQDATEELTPENGWSQEITNNEEVKSYLITVNQMKAGENLTATYGVQIPEKLGYNEKAYENYKVVYTNNLNGQKEETQATALGVSTGVGPELKATLTATVGGEEVKDGDTVAGGETIKYKVKIENVGTEDATNVILHQNIPDNTYCSKYRLCDGCEENDGIHIHKDFLESLEDIKIDLLQPGKSIEQEYQVTVEEETQKDTNITNKLTVQYNNDVTTDSNELNLKTDLGNITVSAIDIEENTNLIAGYDRDLLEFDIINYSGKDIKNVKFKLFNDENLKINSIESDDVDESKISLEEKTVTIDNLEADDVIIICVDLMTNNLNNIKSKINAKVITEDKEYRANEVVYNINTATLSVNQSSNTTNKYVKEGDKIDYTVKFKNNSEMDILGIDFSDEVPDTLTIESIERDGKLIEESNENEIIGNYVLQSGIDLKPGEETEFKIATKVREGAQTSKTQKISNIASAKYNSSTIQSNEIVNYLEALPEDENGNGNGENPGENPGENSGNTNKEGTYSISGTAWYDADEDGTKDSDEELLSNIAVRLLDIDKNKIIKDADGNDIKTTTDEEGFYSLDNVPKGNYIVVFEYDNTKYMPTTYKAEGVDEAINSDVVINKLELDGQEKTIANTDKVTIKDSSIAGINIGLKDIKTFELKLDKQISKVIVQNSKETKTYDFTNTSTTKIELPSKYMKNTNMVIEYEIKVTNIGDAEGYVRSIVDYIPSGLKFSSELNKDWHQLDNNLYNVSLANEKILPGESKTVKLVLTKVVTSEDSEIVNNLAEIAESYSPSGIESENSKAGNKVQGESDMNNADIIIGIATGEIVVNVALITLLTILVIGTGAYLINRKFIKLKI